MDPGTIESQERALKKRGFKHDDPQMHHCAACGEQAIARFVLHGKLGGRDIDVCRACGGAWSWSRRGELAEREQDVTFDLVTFLR